MARGNACLRPRGQFRPTEWPDPDRECQTAKASEALDFGTIEAGLVTQGTAPQAINTNLRGEIPFFSSSLPPLSPTYASIPQIFLHPLLRRLSFVRDDVQGNQQSRLCKERPGQPRYGESCCLGLTCSTAADASGPPSTGNCDGEGYGAG